MFKLKDLLLEDRTRSISKSAAVDTLNSKISHFGDLDNIPKIFRGKENSPDYGYVSPSKFKRESAHTSNYYTLIIDNSDKWSEFPERSKSIVCSTSEERASEYGGIGSNIPLRVFPEIGGKIGVCPQQDIFFSFKELISLGFKNLRDFNNVLEYLIEWIFYPSEKKLSESWPDLKHDLNEIGESQKFLDLYKGNDVFEKYPKSIPSYAKKLIKKLSFEFFPNYHSFYGMVEDIMDPNENGFEITSFKRGVSLPKNREVWTSDDSLLIKVDKLSKLIDVR